MLNEFELIRRYCTQGKAKRDDVFLGQGDDCAILNVPAGHQVAISTDMLVMGTHFLADAAPEDIAHKALMSNISDLAAMGATPAWVSMAISLPDVNEPWLDRFCHTFFEIADAHNLQLVGGDTTKGPLTITLTIQGLLPIGQALTRSGAEVGDLIYVSGNLGAAGAGLSVILDHDNAQKPNAEQLKLRHFQAQSRIALGEQLRGLASSCIDISDGLLGDLSHVLNASNVSADLNLEAIPVSSEVVDFYGDQFQAQCHAVNSGEEYELCFTIPRHLKAQFEEQCAKSITTVSCRCIGQITAFNEGSQRIQIHHQGKEFKQGELLNASSFDNFASN